MTRQRKEIFRRIQELENRMDEEMDATSGYPFAFNCIVDHYCRKINDEYERLRGTYDMPDDEYSRAVWDGIVAQFASASN